MHEAPQGEQHVEQFTLGGPAIVLAPLNERRQPEEASLPRFPEFRVST